MKAGWLSVAGSVASAFVGLCGPITSYAFAQEGEPLPADRATTNYRQLAEALGDTVSRNFFDPNMNGIDFDAVQARYRPLFASVATDEEFLALGNRMIRELGTSHLDVIPPASYWQRQEQAPQGIVTQRLRRLNGDLVYFADARGLATSGLRPGDKILSHQSGLTGAIGGSGLLRVEGCDGRVRPVSVRYLSAEPPAPVHEHRIISGPDGRRIAYARISQFDDDTISFADALIEASSNTDGMIIDVRGNSGGSISALYLANFFMSVSQPTVSMVGRAALTRMGRMPTRDDLAGLPRSSGRYRIGDVLPILMNQGAVTFMSEERGPRRYAKPVTVLVNAGSGSAAEGFAWLMQEFTQATVVGRPSAGALLRGQEFQLPAGWQVTVPVFGLWGPDGRSFIDRPVLPDVVVEWTRADLCRNEDADIAAAMRAMFRR